MRPPRRDGSSRDSSTGCRISKPWRHSSTAPASRWKGWRLTGAWVDREQGLVSTIVLEMGGSSDLCALLKPGEPVVLMGPTGTPTEIAGGETVVLAGGGLGNAVLFSIGEAFRQAGSRVLYFAGYKRMIDRYKVAEIEAAADVVVWCSDEAPGFTATRPQDRAFVGNIVEAMTAYASGALGAAAIPFADVRPAHRHRLGPDDGRRRRRAAHRAGALSQAGTSRNRVDQLADAVHDEGDLRAVPAAAHATPTRAKSATSSRASIRISRLIVVDFPGLAARLTQNAVQEKLTAQWIGVDGCGVRPSAVDWATSDGLTVSDRLPGPNATRGHHWRGSLTAAGDSSASSDFRFATVRARRGSIRRRQRERCSTPRSSPLRRCWSASIPAAEGLTNHDAALRYGPPVRTASPTMNTATRGGGCSRSSRIRCRCCCWRSRS